MAAKATCRMWKEGPCIVRAPPGKNSSDVPKIAPSGGGEHMHTYAPEEAFPRLLRDLEGTAERGCSADPRLAATCPSCRKYSPGKRSTENTFSRGRYRSASCAASVLLPDPGAPHRNTPTPLPTLVAPPPGGGEGGRFPLSKKPTSPSRPHAWRLVNQALPATAEIK